MNFGTFSLDIRIGGWAEPDPLEAKGICSMGSGGGDSYDAEYNARIATIAEEQEEMAKEYFDFWRSDYKPLEQAEIKANMEVIPEETATTIAGLQAERELLPSTTALGIGQNEAALTLLPWETDNAKRKLADENVAMEQKAPVREAFYQESLDGVDANEWANTAAADATQAFSNSMASLSRDAARMGVSPSSGSFAAMGTSNAIEQAKAVGSAKTTARKAAEDENYTRLTNAMGY